tara:strand:- start:1098 stop:1214 length:117 start_codon:yes stop_codon:yes gene_type:complete
MNTNIRQLQDKKKSGRKGPVSKAGGKSKIRDIRTLSIN